MIVLEGILALLMPIFVSKATDVVKKLRVFVDTDYRKTLVRMLVAVLSIVVAVGTALVTDNELDTTVIETSILAIFNGIFATWIYFSKK